MTSFKSDGKTLLLVFVGVVITVALILTVANQVTWNTTASHRWDNETVACPSGANTTIGANGRSLTTITAITDANVVYVHDIDGGTSQNNYTLYTRPYRGELSVVLFANDTGFTNCSTDGALNISYIGVPKGYVGAQSRAITLLIILFSALAILVFVIVMLIKGGSLGNILRRS